MRILVGACVLVGVMSGVRSYAATDSLTVTLRPCAPDKAMHVGCVDVVERLEGVGVGPGQALVEMPLVTSNVETVAGTITGLTAKDAKGVLELRSQDDAGGVEGADRRWLVGRPSSGVVVVEYRAPVSEVLAPRGAAPPLELRSDHGAFSGQGKTFLLLPGDGGVRRVAVHWDLGRMGEGAVGVSSLGVGDVTRSGDAGEILGSSFFMGGRVKVYPAVPPAAGFFAAWYGEAPFELEPVMASEQKLYVFYEKFFKRPSVAPYGVFLRENLVNAGGGVSLGNTSFVTTFGPKTELDEVKITLAHEMLHTFVGGFEPPTQDDAWYAEGVAVYYARLLALRAGQITPAQFLDDLNSTAGRYYTDIMIHTPNSEIAKSFWADTRIRVLPYDRGSMYFAVLDGELRAASGGKQTLDDLLLAMVERRRQKLSADQAAWVELLHAHLGEKGVTEFEAMLGGAVMLPQPDGFGPCFTRVVKPMRRYELGFEPRVLTEHKRIVRGLIAGSAAEKAGVRNGDEITQPVPQDLLQGQQEGVLTLKLLRDGQPLVISYVPRGATVDAYQWARVGGVADSACVY